MINDFIQWVDFRALALAIGLTAGLYVAFRIFTDAHDRPVAPVVKADTNSDTEVNS